MMLSVWISVDKSLMASSSQVVSELRRNGGDLLGYLGERAVAERLEPLRESGFRIFHAVPREGRETNFNIDRVIVVGAFRVANQKLLPAIVRDWKRQALTPDQIDFISRQLDERCRDVEVGKTREAYLRGARRLPAAAGELRRAIRWRS